ncbi:hypothetical protein SCOCK_1020001 [Actinacidiphila cocklensis]|uniref:Uncharacterized protein n=1 Tax=Actinacidiphila cocklensis TaxID=887465 RepID=A0A9W4DPH1_9ACTN|nr:hypothetical protein SCOCK_1020001 [Actinacidiphila cocklensis]
MTGRGRSRRMGRSMGGRGGPASFLAGGHRRVPAFRVVGLLGAHQRESKTVHAVSGGDGGHHRAFTRLTQPLLVGSEVGMMLGDTRAERDGGLAQFHRADLAYPGRTAPSRGFVTGRRQTGVPPGGVRVLESVRVAERGPVVGGRHRAYPRNRQQYPGGRARQQCRQLVVGDRQVLQQRLVLGALTDQQAGSDCTRGLGHAHRIPRGGDDLGRFRTEHPPAMGGCVPHQGRDIEFGDAGRVRHRGQQHAQGRGLQPAGEAASQTGEGGVRQSVNLSAESLDGLQFPTPVGYPGPLLGHRRLLRSQRPSLPADEQLGHGHAVTQIGLDPGLPHLPPSQLDLVRIQLDHVEAPFTQGSCQGPMVVARGFDSDPHAGRIPVVDRRPDGQFEDPGPRQGQLEVDRRADDLAAMIGDQTHRTVLANIHGNDQTPPLREITHSRHVLGLGSASDEIHHHAPPRVTGDDIRPPLSGSVVPTREPL